MKNWNRVLSVMERQAGPEDEEDPEVNDPLSSLGEDDDDGFDDDPWGAEPLFVNDHGFDDADGEEDDDGGDDDSEADDDC